MSTPSSLVPDLLLLNLTPGGPPYGGTIYIDDSTPVGVPIGVVDYMPVGGFPILGAVAAKEKEKS